jgi:hypothetical protein
MQNAVMNGKRGSMAEACQERSALQRPKSTTVAHEDGIFRL